MEVAARRKNDLDLNIKTLDSTNTETSSDT